MSDEIKNDQSTSVPPTAPQPVQPAPTQSTVATQPAVPQTVVYNQTALGNLRPAIRDIVTNASVMSALLNKPYVSLTVDEQAALRFHATQQARQAVEAGREHRRKVWNKKLSDIGSVSVYGLDQQFPVSLYPDQWRKLLTPERVAEILAFCNENQAESDKRKAAEEARKKEERLKKLAARASKGRR